MAEVKEVKAKAVKETFDVKGCKLTAHEKAVYDAVVEKGSVSYADVTEVCGGNAKSAISTLARLNKTHGLLRKNEPVKMVSYEVAE